MALPASINRFITFGCFNNISKTTPEMIQLWVKILNALPGSRLILKFGEAGDIQVRTHCLGSFQACGLDHAGERIEFVGWLPSPKHLELYNSVDIALDTYPYNGTTTTCQALLMGVPVVSLTGQTHASRVGLDILSRLDLQFFAAHTEAEYMNKAIALASNPEALTDIRATMRQRLAASPLCNYRLITSDIENAYRKMWRKHCHSRHGASPVAP
jgi:predicted O-linked N-acetylglucosamine transferase (SPINDLY family)